MSRQPRAHDELLVLRCQEGDAGAFNELIGRWQERLWRHAWRLTGSQDAAWDVVQDAWITVIRGIRRLKDPAAFPTWVYSIASNRCHDWMRRQQRRRRSDEEYAERVNRVENDARSTHQRLAGLDEALSRLPGSDRAILALRYEEQLRVAEIATILQVPPGTVKSRLHYARERLRPYLEEPSDDQT
jgi:RNA polymerase sigma factor (sigma-70 family)